MAAMKWFSDLFVKGRVAADQVNFIGQNDAETDAFAFTPVSGLGVRLLNWIFTTSGTIYNQGNGQIKADGTLSLQGTTINATGQIVANNGMKFSDGTTLTTAPNTVSYAGKALMIYDGNSLWQGTGSSHVASNTTDFAAGPFPSQTRTALIAQFGAATFTSYNFGVAGQTTADMLSDVTSQVDTLFAPATYDRQVVVCGEITNQLANGSGFTAQQAIDNYVAYCKGRRTKGFTVVATTVLPRTAGFTGISASDFETARTTVNNYLRANYLQFADVLADIATLTGITYPDGIHPNDAGYVIIGNYVATKVAPLLVTGFNPQSIAFLLSGSTGTTTPVDTNILLQLNGTGANNSTTIVDSSSYARQVTVSGNAKISTAQAKFGGSSLYFDGTNSYLTIPSSTDFNFGTGDWTAEWWIYPVAQTLDFPALLARGDWANVMWTMSQQKTDTRPALFIQQSNSYVNQNLNSTANAPFNTWTHIAIVSSGGTRKIYTNGTLTGTATGTLSMEANGSLNKPLLVGILPSTGSAVGVGDKWNGYMHLRLWKTAKYTAAFTPPTSF